MSFAENSWVEVRYPLTGEQERGDRAVWPWLPGWVVAQGGLDERPGPRASHGARERDGLPGVLPGFLRAAHPAAKPEAGP